MEICCIALAFGSGKEGTLACEGVDTLVSETLILLMIPNGKFWRNLSPRFFLLVFLNTKVPKSCCSAPSQIRRLSK
jgi:hypothetical protein